jgi:hypothetical protein
MVDGNKGQSREYWMEDMWGRMTIDGAVLAIEAPTTLWPMPILAYLKGFSCFVATAGLFATTVHPSDFLNPFSLRL